ncbi:MAG: hypothetical protein HYW22_01830 [Candidatus Aenigmarchaeota archaeon]|nr:hypothetical protein [Candidatus Aenigmarchaeota archaeon]
MFRYGEVRSSNLLAGTFIFLKQNNLVKVSIVAEGGIARHSYVYGVLDALRSHFGLKNVDYLAASSVSFATLAYYALGRSDDYYYILTRIVPKDRVVNFTNLIKNRPYIDIDFLIEEVAKKHLILNNKNLIASKTKLIVPLTNMKTGRAEYFDNKSKFNFVDIFKASMVFPIPVIGCQPVKIGDNFYFDGGISDPVPVSVPGVKSSKKIIILTKTEQETKARNIEKPLSKIFKWKLNSGLYTAAQRSPVVYRNVMKKIAILESNGDAVIRPTTKMKTFDNSKKAMISNIKQGYRDTVSNKKLPSFIAELKKSNRKNFYFE